MVKYNLIKKSVAVLLGLSLQYCATMKEPLCKDIGMERRRRVETCIFYDREGNSTQSTYTVFNGWNLPVVTVYDKGIDGPDGRVEYEYNYHRKLKRKKGDFRGNQDRLEEVVYNSKGKIEKILIDKEGDGKVDETLFNN